MNPVAFTLFGFEVRWYSILIAISVIISYFMISGECNKFQIKKEFVFNMMFWTLIFGIVGARIYYVVFNLDYYSSHLKEILMIWKGGLAIHGGLLFGFITLVIYCKKYGMRIGKILDIVVVPLLLAQAIGRWGNFFNSEAYGSIVEYQTLLNYKIIPQFVIDNMYIDGAYRLPMFYFESLWCLLGFLIALFIRRRKYIKEKQTFGFYLIWYGMARFVIEIFRSDSLMLGNIKIARVVSVLMIIIGIIIEIIEFQKPKLEELYNKVEVEEIKF
jgi:phosphatidylglycerol:prolipoprotein diacylglycerol transferase